MISDLWFEWRNGHAPTVKIIKMAGFLGFEPSISSRFGRLNYPMHNRRLIQSIMQIHHMNGNSLRKTHKISKEQIGSSGEDRTHA